VGATEIDISKGRYWDRPWSLVDGCTPCSPGCDNCWSAAMAHRFKSQPRDAAKFLNDGQLTNFSGQFNGIVHTRPDRLDVPLKIKKPTVFAIWNDLFHEGVPHDFIVEALRVIESCPQHTFLILTKRAERMFDFFASASMAGLEAPPLQNLWLIPTVCNQQEAEKILPLLLANPTAHRGISIEPMLGPVDLSDVVVKSGPHSGRHIDSLHCDVDFGDDEPFYGSIVDAVILGAETGPKARPIHPDWPRRVRDDCEAAGAPFYFKGWGEWLPGSQCGHISDGDLSTTPCTSMEYGDLCAFVFKVGRKRAGRLLDGRTYDDLPWRTPA
jgi:protein gp37